MTTETPISDAFEQGIADARAIAATIPPSDIRRLHVRLLGDTESSLSPYLRGYVTELRNILRYPHSGVRRGQGGACTGLLTIRLEGPRGCGKSLVAGILRGLLPLLPLDRFVVEEHIL